MIRGEGFGPQMCGPKVVQYLSDKSHIDSHIQPMKKETYLPKQLGMGYVSLRIVSELQFWSVTQRVFLLDSLHLRAINILDLGDMVQLVQKCLGGTAVEVWNFKLCVFPKKVHPKFRWPNHFTKKHPCSFCENFETEKDHPTSFTTSQA